MEETTEEVLFESWMYKLSGEDSKSTLQWSSSWVKRYVLLRRVHQVAYIQYFKSKPKSPSEQPRAQIALKPYYRLEKLYHLKGKTFVCKITTPSARCTLAVDEQKLFHLLVFFLQTQTILKEEITENCFKVRPEGTDAMRKIGARGNMCLLHVSEFGLTLLLELSRCVLAQWPYKTVKTYETTGHGQFALEAGKNSPMGADTYIFKTRAGQDMAVYNTVDKYVNDAILQAQSSNERRVSEVEGLQQYTTVFSDGRFTSQLRRISRDIYDHLWEHLGGDTNNRLKASSSDLLDDSQQNEHLPISRNNSAASSSSAGKGPPPPLPTTAFDHEALDARLHPSPPPANHRYDNGEVLSDPGTPYTEMSDPGLPGWDGQYLQMSPVSSSGSHSPMSSNQQSPPPPASQGLARVGSVNPRLTWSPAALPPQAGTPRQNAGGTVNQNGHPAPRPYVNTTKAPQLPAKQRGMFDEADSARMYMRQRMRSISCEDLKEHFQKTREGNCYVSNSRQGFNGPPNGLPFDNPDVYSYACLPGQEGTLPPPQVQSTPGAPDSFVKMRRHQGGATVEDAEYRDYRSALRRSLSNPNLFDMRHLQTKIEGDPTLRRSKPHLPISFRYLGSSSLTGSSNNVSAGNPEPSHWNPHWTDNGDSRRESDLSSDSTRSSTAPLLPQSSNITSPINVPGIRVTPQTRTFKRQKAAGEADSSLSATPTGSFREVHRSPRPAHLNLGENKENHKNEALC